MSEYDRYAAQLRATPVSAGLKRFVCSCGGGGWMDFRGRIREHKQGCSSQLCLTRHGYMPEPAVMEHLDAQARNVAHALAMVVCLRLGDQAGWQHHRCRDVEGKWTHWNEGRSWLRRAGMWTDRPYPFSDESEDDDA